MTMKKYEFILTIFVVIPIICAWIEIAYGNYSILSDRFYDSFFVATLTYLLTSPLIRINKYLLSKLNYNKLIKYSLLYTLNIISLCIGLYFANIIVAYLLGYNTVELTLEHFGIGFFYASLIILVIISFKMTILYYKNKIKHERKLKDLEIQNLKTKLDVLTTKTNPHFLFNALNSLVTIAQENPKLTEKMLLEVSSMYRKILESMDKKYLTLNEELKICSYYLNTQQLRFGEKFKYTISEKLNLKTEKIKIPTLAIQNILENSIKYSIEQRKERGQIQIEITEDKENILIKIKDPGSQRRSSQPSTGLGLNLTIERCKLLYLNNFSLEYDFEDSQSHVLMKIGKKECIIQ